MAYFLIQAAYTPESWAAQIRSQENAEDRVRPVIEGLGGRLGVLYYAFGEYDVVAIGEFPTNDAAAAFSLAVTAGGALKTVKTTPLMTISEGIAAMKKAGDVTGKYKPPVTKSVAAVN